VNEDLYHDSMDDRKEVRSQGDQSQRIIDIKYSARDTENRAFSNFVNELQHIEEEKKSEDEPIYFDSLENVDEDDDNTPVNLDVSCKE